MNTAIRMLIAAIMILNVVQADSLEQKLAQADSLVKAEELSKAVEILEACARQYPDNAVVQMKLGRALGEKSGQDFQAGDLNGAMECVNRSFDALETSISLDENNAESRLTYGIMGIEIPPFFGKLKPAVQHLEKAKTLLELNPTKENRDARLMVYRYLGEGYKRQEKYREAENIWKMLLMITTEGDHAKAAREGLAFLEKVDTEPKETSKPSVVPETDNIPALLERGKAYLAENKYPEARACFEKVMALDEKHVQGQMLLIQAIAGDAERDYDERVYDDQDTRTHLAFDMVHEMSKGVALAPDNLDLKFQYAMACLYMPFFVSKTDEGIALLESMLKDTTLSDSMRCEVLFGLGFGHLKKGKAYWAHLVQSDQEAGGAKQIYEYYGTRDFGSAKKINGDHIRIRFHLGFQDELAPQTAVWIKDEAGNFVKTIYVSGFAGHAREKQVNLPQWGKATGFETDGTTSASIDWGTHTYVWDLTNHEGKRVKKGAYTVWLEVSWWPTYQYALTNVEIEVSKKETKVVTRKEPFIPVIEVEYIK
ncbi:DUF2271 domain-containing protein [bacterium]|nr:DUF2271 domain-containing protein [bacterium]